MIKNSKTKFKKVTEAIDWLNIEHEQYRTYVFSNGLNIVIKSPRLLNISSTGSHRVLDADNVAHYIPKGWVHLYWETVDDVAFRF
jgi:hypothetical protein